MRQHRKIMSFIDLTALMPSGSAHARSILSRTMGICLPCDPAITAYFAKLPDCRGRIPCYTAAFPLTCARSQE
jgi:hypothetical protein